MKYILNLIKFLLITLGGIIIFFPIILVYMYIADDKDACLDTGYCKEGLFLNLNGKRVMVNEQSCIENNGKWLSVENICQFK